MSSNSCHSFHFIVSAPRSGSTWLARALGRHPQVVATENRLFGNFCDVWQNHHQQPSVRITFDAFAQSFARHTLIQQPRDEFVNDFIAQYLEFLGDFLRRQSGKAVVVDKVTPYLGTSQTVLQSIRRYFPSSKIVFLIRDGRDVATSGVFDWITRESADSPRYRYFVKDERPTAGQHQRFFDDEVIGQWSQHWNEVFDAFGGTSSDLTVRYEDMISDQTSQLVKIFRLIGVTAERDLAEEISRAVSFSATTGRQAGDARPLDKARNGMIGDWQNYFTRVDAEQFCKSSQQTLVEAGYEVNQAWVNRCPAAWCP